MEKWIDDMYEICDKLTEELAEVNDKMDNNGGKMSSGDLDVIDKLTHAIKSARTILAMEQYDDERSGDYRTDTERMDNRSGVYRGGSYAPSRGRGRYAKRDSRGRYSSEYGYSRTDAMHEFAESIRNAMPTLPDNVKKDAEKLLRNVEQM